MNRGVKCVDKYPAPCYNSAKRTFSGKDDALHENL